MILYIFIVLLGGIPAFFDQINYNNYFYSSTHIKPEYVYFFTGLLFVLTLFKYKKNILWLIFIFFIGINTPQILGITFGRLYLVIKNAQNFKEEKLLSTYGDKIKFIENIKTYIPEKSRILIPPDQASWRYTGSVQLMQAMLYPIQVYTASYGWVLDKESFYAFDYILISSESISEEPKIWPDFNIDTKEILIYDWNSGKLNSFNNKTYDYNYWQKEKAWGLLIPKPSKKNK